MSTNGEDRKETVVIKEGYDKKIKQDFESGVWLEKDMPTVDPTFATSEKGQRFLEKLNKLVAKRDVLHEVDWWMYDQAVQNKRYPRLSLHYKTCPIHNYKCCFAECGKEMGMFETIFTQGKVECYVMEQWLHFFLHHNVEPSDAFLKFMLQFDAEKVELPPKLTPQEALKKPSEDDLKKMEIITNFVHEMM